MKLSPHKLDPEETRMPQKESTPNQWLSTHFIETRKSITELAHHLNYYKKGLEAFNELKKHVDGLLEVQVLIAKQELSEGDKKWQDKHNKLVEAVRIEIDSDFSRLNGLAIIGLWSELEHFCKRLIILSIVNKPEVLQYSSFDKIKLRVCNLFQSTPEEQAWLISESIERELSSHPRKGSEKLESLLSYISLHGKVKPETYKTMREFQLIRNIYAHTHGIADRKFVTEMPEFKDYFEKRVNISQNMIESYFACTLDYISTVENRTGVKRNVQHGEDSDPKSP